jgi:hypothetical protein
LNTLKKKSLNFLKYAVTLHLSPSFLSDTISNFEKQIFVVIPVFNDWESCHLLVKAIREKTLGKEHLDYAKSLMILGVIFQNMDAYEQAELFMLNAIAIYEKILGKEHADYASSLNSLASLYKDMDNRCLADRKLIR